MMCATICSKEMLQRLNSGRPVELKIGHSTVTMALAGKEHALSLATTVYQGENYIPISVRQCVVSKPPFNSWLRGSRLVIDEQDYRVDLLIEKDDVEHPYLSEVLEEFGRQADEWRLYLDDHDKKDLLPVFIRRN